MGYMGSIITRTGSTNTHWRKPVSSISPTCFGARFFELRLLDYVGYRPQLFYCVGCNARIEPTANFFSLSEGGVLCPRCGEERLQRGRGARQEVQPIPLNALKVLRYLQTRDYALCRRLRISPGSHGELEDVMRRYITYLLERRLKSLEFLDTLRREAIA